MRYESYLNALADYDPEFKGNGIPYRYATYSIDGLEVTVGNYYEQLGSGLIFRSYEEKGLGIDNAMDGVRLKYSPLTRELLKKHLLGKAELISLILMESLEELMGKLISMNYYLLKAK